MLTRLLSRWPAGGAALLLVLALSGVVAAASVVAVVTAPRTRGDPPGHGLRHEPRVQGRERQRRRRRLRGRHVVDDPTAAAAAEAAVDTNHDGTISVSEAAHSDRTGGKNCNHGGYVSSVAHAPRPMHRQSTTTGGGPAGAITEQDRRGSTAPTAPRTDETDATDATDSRTTEGRLPGGRGTAARPFRIPPRTPTGSGFRAWPNPTRQAARTATTAARSARRPSWARRSATRPRPPARPRASRPGTPGRARTTNRGRRGSGLAGGSTACCQRRSTSINQTASPPGRYDAAVGFQAERRST